MFSKERIRFMTRIVMFIDSFLLSVTLGTISAAETIIHKMVLEKSSVSIVLLSLESIKHLSIKKKETRLLENLSSHGGDSSRFIDNVRNAVLCADISQVT